MVVGSYRLLSLLYLDTCIHLFFFSSQMKIVPPLSPGWLDTKLVEVLCRLLLRLNWIVSDILC